MLTQKLVLVLNRDSDELHQILVLNQENSVSTEVCFILKLGFTKIVFTPKFPLHENRDGKTYERASNTQVNFFIVLLKSVTNSMLFCSKSELCCNFAFFGGDTYGFHLVNF